MLCLLLFAVLQLAASTFGFSPSEMLTPAFPNACSGCEYTSTGTGYVRHPYYCNKYILCVRDTQQYFIKTCPSGLYWNNAILACDWPTNVNCSTWQPSTTRFDFCSIRRRNKNNTRAYHQLVGEYLILKLCRETEIYDENECQCVLDPCYDKEANQADNRYYLQRDNGVWIQRPCAPGSVFNNITCTCDIHATTQINQVCRPTLLLTLSSADRERDSSPNQLHVDNHGVTFTQHGGFWKIGSYLSIPFFTNGYYGNQLTISFTFKRVDYASRVLLSNSICGDVKPSILIYVTYGYICYQIQNEAGVKAIGCQYCGGVGVWRDVSLKLKDNKLTSNMCGGTHQRQFAGLIASTKCPLTIGKSVVKQPFWGFIKQLSVFIGCCPCELPDCTTSTTPTTTTTTTTTTFSKTPTYTRTTHTTTTPTTSPTPTSSTTSTRSPTMSTPCEDETQWEAPALI